MKRNQLTLLLHPAFLLSIFLLLLNDISLKYEFHNWFTGKLSDFTGLFALSLFLIAFFPARKKLALVLIALFFVWWKSELADPFIRVWNNFLPIEIGRVVDFTDLLALLVLPLAYYFPVPHSPFYTPHPLLIRSVSLVALFSFCFTSMPRQAMYYEHEKDLVMFGETYRTRKSEQQMLQKLADLNISYHLDSVEYNRLATHYKVVMRNSGDKDSNFVWKPIPNNSDSAIFIKQEQSPFYVIPYYNLDGDELYDLKFSLYPNKKKLDIYIRSFRSSAYVKDLPSGKKKKKYRKHFTELFK